MKPIVFTGPTLSARDARLELDAVYMPPVSQGDVLRAAKLRPPVIGIIDGYFERVPAVWHKEILWSLFEGIPVFGSASMGALRAAELEAFGMVGVGSIFEAYRDGSLEDDDEVALAHQMDTEQQEYAPVSEAMVNIRYTLRAAEEAGVLSRTTRLEVEQIAKKLFYPRRTYPEILQHARINGLPESEIHFLAEWIPHGAIDQKRNDARQMLREIKNRLAQAPVAPIPRFSFEATSLWREAVRRCG